MSGTKTAYKRVADAIRKRILDGKCPAGQRLATERELCEEFRTSRVTVRLAMKLLEDESLLIRRQGSGTYVNPNPARRIPLAYSNFTRSMKAHAPEMKRKVVDMKWIVSGQSADETLPAPPGKELLWAMRVDVSSDGPVAADELWLDASCSSRLGRIDLERMDFFERWQEVEGIELHHAIDRLEAEKAQGRIAKILSIKSGTPMLVETCDMYADEKTWIGRFLSWYRYDLYFFESNVSFRDRTIKSK